MIPLVYKFPDEAVDYIEEQTRKLSWLFFPDSAYSDLNHSECVEKNPYFSCGFMDTNPEKAKQLGAKSPFYGTHYEKFPWDFISESIELETNLMKRAHMTLHLPNESRFGKPHNPHVDSHDDHLVALYYVNDTDGDTFFFDERKQVYHQETPERGKMVVFEGAIWHSSSSPSKNERYTLNINYNWPNCPDTFH